MRPLLRIRLRTVFLLFFCAAVGLATYRDPLGALEPAIATAMVIGLLQQTRQLWRWKHVDLDARMEFARQFALVWRVCVALIISSCVLIPMLNGNGMLPLDDERRVWLLTHALQPITSISLTAVLCNSLARWRSGTAERANPQNQTWHLWLIAILGLLVLVQGSLILFLVHEANAGIEAAIPARFQRPGIYPDLSDEAFGLFWIAVAATASLIMASVTLIQALQASGKRRRMAAIAVSGLLLTVPILFCGWYYFSEFHRISPELAGAGLDSGGVQWLVGGALAFALITASAYQLARSDLFKETISTDLSHEIDSTSLHESGPVLLLIGIYSLHVMVLLIVDNAQVGNWFMPPHPVWFYISALWNPTSLLVLAQAVVGLQLCWIRYRRRSQITAWVLPGLSRPQFLQNWVALLVLLVIAIPTLNAFAFIAWLGPLNLLPLFGF